jgi:hypothetical protein
MQKSYIGSLRILQLLPWWVILFIGPLCTTGVIWLLRVIFEGRLYDYSLASFPGDLFIFIYLFCVGQICKKETFSVNFFWGKSWHLIIFFSAFCVTTGLYGLALTQGGTRARFTLLPANLYHFIVQLALSYAVVSSFPVIVMTKYKLFQSIAIVCLILYICLLVYDIRMGNLGQHIQ